MLRRLTGIIAGIEHKLTAPSDWAVDFFQRSIIEPFIVGLTSALPPASPRSYTGARLAAGAISFEQVGKELPPQVVTIPYQKAVFQGDSIMGNIPILDVQYGNVWTNINDSIFKVLHVEPKEKMEVNINRNGIPVFNGDVEFVHTFGDVPEGKVLAYMNSLMNFSLAINMGNMADSFHINSGAEWNIVVRRKKPN